MAVDAELQSSFESWMANDWCEASRIVMKALYEGKNEDQARLKAMLIPRISFGTAGLRAEMLPGFANFNHVTVRQAVLGLADYLHDQFGSDAHEHGVVVGHDHRATSPSTSLLDSKVRHPDPMCTDQYRSDDLAALTAYILNEKGFHVHWIGQCHTPLVPHAVRSLKAVAGVMITASHNPKSYNGLKVYWRSGCQINQPHDKGIAAAIAHNLNPSAFPPAHISHVSDDSLRSRLETEYQDRLLQRATSIRGQPVGKVVVTAMHGVGAPCIEAILTELAGSTQLSFASWVEAQKYPDPAFPTVAFPNPEEKGALDMATKQADAEGVDTILAVDPDADRFAAAEKLENGVWHRFTGNEMGVLLAMHTLDDRLDIAHLDSASRSKIAVLTTAVSTAALGHIAEIEGIHCEETLTGFKWMANRAQELEAQGYRVVFAFEEALGYMFPDVVYDKDGVAALVEFLVARHLWKSRQQLTPAQKLDTIYKKYGYYADANTYVVSPSSHTTNKVFAAIRKAQQDQDAFTRKKPAVLAGRICKSYRDLTTGVDTSQPDNNPKLPVDIKTHMISCEIDDARFTVRGSGTEPKVKLYVESKGLSLADAQAKANALQRMIIDDWLQDLK